MKLKMPKEKCAPERKFTSPLISRAKRAAAMATWSSGFCNTDRSLTQALRDVQRSGLSNLQDDHWVLHGYDEGISATSQMHHLCITQISIERSIFLGKVISTCDGKLMLNFQSKRILLRTRLQNI